MTNEEKQDIALCKYRILSDLICGMVPYDSKAKYFREKAEQTWKDNNGKEFKVSVPTLERWYYNYRKFGFDGLVPRNRNDAGRARKLGHEELGIIEHYVNKHPRMPATVIYDEMIKNGHINYDQISITTFTRYVTKLKSGSEVITTSEMKRYEAQFINDIWCCDTTFTYKVDINGKKQWVCVIGIIDDASRMIVGAEAFLNDNYVNFLSVLKKAVSKYGKPKVLNLDNGGTYKNRQLDLLSARTGINLFHNKPYFGQGKAKIERWFRTMKDHYLSTINTKTTTLEQFRIGLQEYITEYNKSEHKSIHMSPVSRFFDSGDEILRLDEDFIDKAFLLEVERKVSPDCVVQLDTKSFEVPQKYSNKKILVRYSSDYKTCYVVNADETLTKIDLLDKVANSKIKRQQPKFDTEE